VEGGIRRRRRRHRGLVRAAPRQDHGGDDASAEQRALDAADNRLTEVYGATAVFTLGWLLSARLFWEARRSQRDSC
jgi:hypothetical protein